MSDLPRVTEILAAVGLGPDLSMVPPDVLAAAQKRGTAVHEAIEALAYGYLDEAAVDPAIAPYLDAYRKFLVESGHEAIASEVEVINPAWQYVGHLDRIGWLLGKRVILDFKTGVALAGVEYQLAAYGAAWDAQHPTELVAGAAAVQLRDDGTYRFHEVEISAALPVWYAALTIYRAQEKTRR